MAKKATKAPQDVYAACGTTKEEHQEQFMSFIEKKRAEAQERLDEMEKLVEKKKREKPALAGSFSPRRAAIGNAAISMLAISGKPASNKSKMARKGQGVIRTQADLKAQGIEIKGVDLKRLEEYALTGKIDGVVLTGTANGVRKGGKKGRLRRGRRKGPIF